MTTTDAAKRPTAFKSCCKERQQVSALHDAAVSMSQPACMLYHIGVVLCGVVVLKLEPRLQVLLPVRPVSNSARRHRGDCTSTASACRFTQEAEMQKEPLLLPVLMQCQWHHATMIIVPVHDLHDCIWMSQRPLADQNGRIGAVYPGAAHWFRPAMVAGTDTFQAIWLLMANYLPVARLVLEHAARFFVFDARAHQPILHTLPLTCKYLHAYVQLNDTLRWHSMNLLTSKACHLPRITLRAAFFHAAVSYGSTYD